MKRVGIVGHFGIGHDLLNGQTIKTKIVSEELEKSVGKENIAIVDTHGGAKKALLLPFRLFGLEKRCENIVIMPAKRGVRVIAPILSLLNKFFRRRLHYVVIGGWLPELCSGNRALTRSLKAFDRIYVETESMKKALAGQGFGNLCVMPNFKKIGIVAADSVPDNYDKPYRLCTFSRVMKEKGIEDAVRAVNILNGRAGRNDYLLDIYGQIEKGQEEWFSGLEDSFGDTVRYMGCVPYEKSVETISGYYALLFPTYYSGEGFAGTVIDAMASGVPIVASSWRYNSEIVTDGFNGLLFPERDASALADRIEKLASVNRREMCLNAIETAKKYIPSNAVSVLLNNLR